MNVLLIARANDAQAYLEAINNEVSSIYLALDRVKNHVDIRERSGFNFEVLHNEFTAVDKVSILHYCGHSDPEGLRVFNPHTNTLLKKEHLKQYLKTQQGLKLVFLNSCYSTAIAEALSAAGIPVVIGTSAAIGDALAAEVARVFYENLGSGKQSIRDAFEHTKVFFKQKPEQQYAAFRGPDIAGAPYPWKIMCKDQEYANWRLVPRSLAAQLDQSGKKYHVLVVAASNKIFEAFKKPLLPLFQDIHFYSIQELGDDERPDQARAIQKADRVLYLVTDGLVNLLDDGNDYSWAKEPLKTVSEKHLISWSGNTEETIRFLSQNEFISSDAKRFPTENDIKLGEDFNEIILPKILKMKKEEIAKLVGAGNLKELLGYYFPLLNFKDQREKVAFKPSQPFNCIFIEGTPDCGQELLVRRIMDYQKLNIPSNKKPYRFGLNMNFDPSEPFDKDDIFWLLANELKIRARTNQAFCQKLLSRLDEEEVLIFIVYAFKGWSNKVLKDAFSGFWKDFNELLPSYTGKGRFFLIVVNDGFDGENCCISTLELDAAHQQLNPMVLPVIEPLKAKAFEEWHDNVKPAFREFNKFMALRDKEEEISKQRIRKVVTKICEILDCDEPTYIFDYKTINQA
jgi:hypothetical protein